MLLQRQRFRKLTFTLEFENTRPKDRIHTSYFPSLRGRTLTRIVNDASIHRAGGGAVQTAGAPHIPRASFALAGLIRGERTGSRMFRWVCSYVMGRVGQWNTKQWAKGGPSIPVVSTIYGSFAYECGQKQVVLLSRLVRRVWYIFMHLGELRSWKYQPFSVVLFFHLYFGSQSDIVTIKPSDIRKIRPIVTNDPRECRIVISDTGLSQVTRVV